jgi:hypothetical protein
MLARPHRPRLSSRISSRLRLARRRPPPHRARGTRWLHSVPRCAHWWPAHQRSSPWPRRAWWQPAASWRGHALCWTAQRTVGHAPGCASVLCSALGRLAADVAIRPPSAASAGLHRFSTVWRVVRQRSGRWRLWHRLHRAPTVRLRRSCALAINVPGPPGALSGGCAATLEPHSRRRMEPGLPGAVVQHHVAHPAHTIRMVCRLRCWLSYDYGCR